MSSSAANPVFGSTVSITAKVAGPDGTVPPTGEVKFLVGPDLLRSVPLNSKGEAVLAISSLPLGANNIQATYDGDANFYGAAPASTLVTVTPASTMLTISGPATAYAGDAVKITAHLSSAFSSPTGTVDFLWNGQSLGSGAVDADGDAVLTTTSLNFGNNQITASYAGTAAYLPSTSEALNIQMLATDFSITAPSTTLSLAAGQTADLPLTITSVGSFNETLWLSCSGLPSFVQCQFSQSSVVPTSGGANVKLTLSVAKTLPAIQISGVLGGGAFLFLIPGVLRRKRLLKGVFVVTLLSVAMTFCNGCGGSRPAINSNIPAGSYQITVNAKGTSVTHSTNVVLSVTK